MDKMEFWRRMNDKNTVSNGKMKPSLTADPRKRNPRTNTNFDLVGLYRQLFDGVRPDAEDPEDPEEYLELARMLFGEFSIGDRKWLDKVHSNLHNVPEIYPEDYLFIEEPPLERQTRPESPVASRLEHDNLIEQSSFNLQSLSATLPTVDDQEAIEDEPAISSSRPISPLVPQGGRPALNMQVFLNSRQRMGSGHQRAIPLRCIALVNAREVREAFVDALRRL